MAAGMDSLLKKPLRKDGIAKYLWSMSAKSKNILLRFIFFESKAEMLGVEHFQQRKVLLI